jgi:structure-specific endonuclease subunit SLX1
MGKYAYMLVEEATKRTYIGSTNNPERRLRQHNQEVSGGAKSTKTSKQWQYVVLVSGFRHAEHRSFEYWWKHKKCSVRGILNVSSRGRKLHARVRQLLACLSNHPLAKKRHLVVDWHSIPETLDMRPLEKND